MKFAAGEETLCNLRFAYDIILLAYSRRQLQAMLSDLSFTAASVGPEIHAGKTKFLTNQKDVGGFVECEGYDVEVTNATE